MKNNSPGLNAGMITKAVQDANYGKHGVIRNATSKYCLNFCLLSNARKFQKKDMSTGL